jgi:adenylosuccinate lyase
MTFTHDTFLSPSTWRYGSAEMRSLWSETERRRLMRRIWVALASAQHAAGLVSSAQLDDLIAHQDQIDLERALAIEAETRHDIMAEIRCYAEQCAVGGGIIHWGATSADVTDNVDVLRIRSAARLIHARLAALLAGFAARIEASADLPVMAHTHIQPAEPTTLGYRMAVYAQDLHEDWCDLGRLIGRLRGKGFKGAVGTQAGYDDLLRGTPLDAAGMEAHAMRLLDLPPFPIATQTYTRQQDLRVLNVLSGIAASLHKFALDFRILQSPPFGEWAEPFGRGQVGSSAMPFKRNPIGMENVCSLARLVGALPAVAWDNASQAILERSLDDSANRRYVLPEAFLLVDEMVGRVRRVLDGMRLDERAMARNLATYGPFAATERVLMALVAAGASRQEGHEWLRESSLQAWEALRNGTEENPLARLLVEDGRIRGWLSAETLTTLMQANDHTGTAPQRARRFAAFLREVVDC